MLRADLDLILGAVEEELDVRRREASHVGFGYGARHCLGAPLARMELQVALGALLTRLPGLSLTAEDDITWNPACRP
ncbi:cytochrome P450 [Kribbella sp. NPDC000426]|uniref:cytochrome P450 n=1 Tax=Kribbella sp. NPDC000426 TaxID=3154255 RepID=UPI00332AD423